MAGIELIILGLIFDIFGAFLIIRPLLDIVRKVKGDFGGEVLVQSDPVIDRDVMRSKKNQDRVRIGLGFLLTGFGLQIIGNYLQHLELVTK